MSTATLELETRALAPASFRPKSADEKSRTCEIVVATGQAVPRMDDEGAFREVLRIDDASVDLSRIEAGSVPLLDAHQSADLDDVLGRIIEARIEDGKLVATAKFSERAAAVFADIAEGILASASCGYTISAYEDSTDSETGERTRTVTNWQLIEASLTPIAADPAASTRGATMPNANPAPAATPATPPANRATVNREIRALGREFAIAQNVVDDLIDRNGTIEEARSLAIEASRANAGRPLIAMGYSSEDPAIVTRAMAEGLHCRINPAVKPSDQAKPYRNLSLIDIARQSLALRSITTTGFGTNELVTRALTTSDFPILLGDVAQRSILPAYERATSALKMTARQISASDFRTMTRVRLGEAANLEKVNEHGEFKHSSLSESGESYKISTFGRIITLSRAAIVNDDLNAFGDMAAMLGQAAGETEAQLFVDLFELNGGLGPVMTDGEYVFSGAHGNLETGTSTIGEPDGWSLSSARVAMRTQTGVGGKTINIPPKYLIVPPQMETISEQYLATIQPNKATDVNVFAGTLELLVESRFADPRAWYVAADPQAAAGLEYAYLNGSEGPQIDTRAGFDIDGVETKATLDFGCAFIDYRGWFLNPGM